MRLHYQIEVWYGLLGGQHFFGLLLVVPHSQSIPDPYLGEESSMDGNPTLMGFFSRTHKAGLHSALVGELTIKCVYLVN